VGFTTSQAPKVKTASVREQQFGDLISELKFIPTSVVSKYQFIQFSGWAGCYTALQDIY